MNMRSLAFLVGPSSRRCVRRLGGAGRRASRSQRARRSARGPVYQNWQPAWDRYQFDRRHVMLGTVASFQRFRLELARRDGVVQMIDLKNGTVILPTGTTPMRDERVAVVGYFSRGTFIANRVLVHP